MEKLVYKYNEKFGYWPVSEFISEKNSLLELLITSFNEYRDWITLEINGNKVVIWNDADEKYFSSQDIPKLELSKENYKQIISVWNDNIDNPTPYLILSQDDTGWINLERKTELSAEDLKYIEKEKQQQKLNEK